MAAKLDVDDFLEDESFFSELIEVKGLDQQNARLAWEKIDKSGAEFRPLIGLRHEYHCSINRASSIEKSRITISIVPRGLIKVEDRHNFDNSRTNQIILVQGKDGKFRAFEGSSVLSRVAFTTKEVNSLMTNIVASAVENDSPDVADNVVAETKHRVDAQL